MEWPRLSQDFRSNDATRAVVYARLNAGVAVAPESGEWNALVEASAPAHEESLVELRRVQESRRHASKLKQVNLLDRTNALVAYELKSESIGRPHYSGIYHHLYALNQQEGVWVVVATYRLMDVAVVE